MIILHTFGPAWGLPDPSPFVTKADILLKMSGVPYAARATGLRGAPKGKLPYIEDNGVLVADSTFIRFHLETKYQIDFDKSLSADEKGIAWAIEKMLEDHLYFTMLLTRWLDDENFNKGPRRFFAALPAPLRPFIVSSVRRKIRKGVYSQGIGRHAPAEAIMLANRCIDALAAVLGNKPYLMGASACGADATAFAFVAGFLCPLFRSEVRMHAERQANLVAYRDRLMQEFYA